MRTSWGRVVDVECWTPASLEECLRIYNIHTHIYIYIYENIHYPIISPAPIWKLCFGWLRSPQSESVRGRGRSFFSRTPLTFQLESRAPRNTRPARGISTLTTQNIKGTVNVILNDPQCKDGNVWFTTVALKAWSDKVWIRYQCFCLSQLFFFSFAFLRESDLRSFFL